MALRVFAIAIVLFLAEIVFLTTKDFKDSSSDRKDLDFTDISFENIQSYLITKEGCEAKLEASKVLKYKDHAKIYDIKTEFTRQNRQNNIQANYALLKGDIIHLTGAVHYEDNASLVINSEDLVYNTKTKIVTIDLPFTLTSQNGNVQGNNLIYDQVNGTIKAKNIKYESKK
ncbi:MAG TPA: LPS export ABC transporter periplasmic protein LptC [Campylobacterales bacterium]|nr:LPS export ABC transporter periplasmic protein LptC [Campylobacterales bacterium]